MPNSSFIITLNLSNVSLDALASTADDIGNELLDSGFDVVDSKPWAHPSLQGGLVQQVEAPQQEFGSRMQGPPSLPFGGAL